MKRATRKATRHINQNEGLIFEKSSPGKAAWKLPPLDVPDVDTNALLGSAERKDLGNMPEVSEIEIIRHFTRLSTWNYAIDLGMYPLGSCTMKYNPRVNEVVSRLDGLANGHPYQPEKVSQGALRILQTLSECLIEITGMDAITLQPAAGAHGELTGLLMVRAFHQSKGAPRKKILIPDSAHGTNPATAATVGYAVENLKSNDRGMVDPAALAAQMNEDVAALMLTNPNTLGVAVYGHREYNPGWNTALDLKNLLTVSEAITRAAIERKESRGGHFREDFPGKNAADGKVNVIVKKNADGTMQVRREPIPEMPAELKQVIEEMK